MELPKFGAVMRNFPFQLPFLGLSHLCHPDKVAPELRDEAEEEFKKLAQAYTVLYALAPDDPPRPKAAEPKARTTEAPRPKTESPKSKPEPERPKKTEAPKTGPKPKTEPTRANTSAQAKPMGAAPQQEPKPKNPYFDPAQFSKPKYF